VAVLRYGAKFPSGDASYKNDAAPVTAYLVKAAYEIVLYMPPPLLLKSTTMGSKAPQALMAWVEREMGKRQRSRLQRETWAPWERRLAGGAVARYRVIGMAKLAERAAAVVPEWTGQSGGPGGRTADCMVERRKVESDGCRGT
jgi:hypothetical protein